MKIQKAMWVVRYREFDEIETRTLYNIHQVSDFEKELRENKQRYRTTYYPPGVDHKDIKLKDPDPVAKD